MQVNCLVYLNDCLVLYAGGREIRVKSTKVFRNIGRARGGGSGEDGFAGSIKVTILDN